MSPGEREMTDRDLRAYRRTRRGLHGLLVLVLAVGAATPFVAQALGIDARDVLIGIYVGTLLCSAIDLIRVPTTTSLEWLTRARVRHWILWVCTISGTSTALLV